LNQTNKQTNDGGQEHKRGKRVVVKGKFVFNTKEILELIEEVEIEALKRKSKKKQIVEL
jgi:hypothetical protein